MMTMRACALLGAAMLLLVSIAAPARAGLVQDLSTDFGSGQITFKDLSGTTVDRIEAFSFDVLAGFAGGPQSYGLADIRDEDLDWSIDDQTWALSLTLVTNLKPLGENQSGIILSNQLTAPGILCPPGQGGLQASGAGSVECIPGSTIPDFIRSPLSTRAVGEVPEPTTIALFVIALGGLGFMARQRFS